MFFNNSFMSFLRLARLFKSILGKAFNNLRCRILLLFIIVSFTSLVNSWVESFFRSILFTVFLNLFTMFREIIVSIVNNIKHIIIIINKMVGFIDFNIFFSKGWTI